MAGRLPLAQEIGVRVPTREHKNNMIYKLIFYLYIKFFDRNKSIHPQSVGIDVKGTLNKAKIEGNTSNIPLLKVSGDIKDSSISKNNILLPSKEVKIIWHVLLDLAVALICAYLIYQFGWN